MMGPFTVTRFRSSLKTETRDSANRQVAVMTKLNLIVFVTFHLYSFTVSFTFPFMFTATFSAERGLLPYLTLRLNSAEVSEVSTALTAILPAAIKGPSKKLELDDACNWSIFLRFSFWCCKQSYCINKPSETSPQYKPGGWQHKCMTLTLIRCSQKTFSVREQTLRLSSLTRW